MTADDPTGVVGLPGAPQILVIDDSGENRFYIRRRLSQDGYDVTEASSGPEGLELLERAAVDLVILDMQMPGMDGLATLEELRRRHPFRRLPVLMLSADTQTSSKVEALERGADDYLPKPLEYDFLKAKLRQYLRPPVTATPEVGHTFAHYTLLQLLGEGGMGRVFRAEDMRLGREVALKVMIGTPRDGMPRLLREARALSSLELPNLTRIYEVGEMPLPFIAMELVEGQELARVELPRPRQAAAWLAQVADTLHIVHEQGILHRDLKPSNLMLSSSGQMKILDFGLAKQLGDSEQLTRTGELWGTPIYMAPEHFDMKLGPIDQASDVYALGVILYGLLAGAPPFRNESLGVLITDVLHSPVPPLPVSVPPELARICLGALARSTARRFPSAGAFAEALHDWLGDR